MDKVLTTCSKDDLNAERGVAGVADGRHLEPPHGLLPIPRLQLRREQVLHLKVARVKEGAPEEPELSSCQYRAPSSAQTHQGVLLTIELHPD